MSLKRGIEVRIKNINKLVQKPLGTCTMKINELYERLTVLFLYAAALKHQHYITDQSNINITFR